MAIAVAGGLLAAPAGQSLAAATPIPAGEYVGSYYDSATEQQASALLSVSRDGKALVPRRGSYVAAYSPCLRERGGEDGGSKLLPTSSVRIRSDGSFRLVEHQEGATLRMRGRFTRRWSVRLVVRVRARPERPREPGRPGFCTAGPSVIRLKHVGEVPFRDCRTHPAETVGRSPEGRVFLHYRRRGVTLLERAYGCLFSTQERFLLGATDREGIGGPTMFELAGPYAGYVFVGCSAACGYTVYVNDLRNGAVVKRLSFLEGVTDLVVSPSGAVAFIENPRFEAVAPEVRIATGASAQVVDSGEGIDLDSLELEGNLVSWIKDGIRRTAPLE